MNHCCTHGIGRWIVAAATVALILVPPSGAQVTWDLVWQDEFDGVAVDESKWSFQTGDGCPNCTWGNGELQWYRAENATVENGHLIITAKEESFGGLDYTSARLRTINKGDWKYGRFEVRAKLPVGQGMWPAIWMLPTSEVFGGWAASGEIDIMEMRGDVPNQILGTIYYGRPFPEQQSTSVTYTLPSGDFASGFHVFELQWDPWEIRWYVDGILYRTERDWFSVNARYPAPFNNEFHLLLNLAVGGNFPGPPDATTQFPQSMEVDYVRVYRAVGADPTATLTAPEPGETLVPGGNVTLTATASDVDGSVLQVEFYQDEGLLGTVLQPPYSLEVDGLAAGCYTIRAVATNDLGRRGESDVANVTVGDACPEQYPYLLAASPIPGVVEAEYFDIGGEDVAYNDTDAGNSGSLGIRASENVDISAAGLDVGFAVVRTNRTEWMEYTVNVEETAIYDAIFRIGSSAPTASFRLEFGGVDKTGRVEVPTTGGDTEWTNLFVAGIPLDAGVQTMRFVSNTSGMGINRIIFQKSSSTGTEGATADEKLRLEAPYPNPATSTATIRYRLPGPSAVTLDVYDLLGRLVYSAVRGIEGPGVHSAVVQTDNLPGGVYVYRLNTDFGKESRLMAVHP